MISSPSRSGALASRFLHLWTVHRCVGTSPQMVASLAVPVSTGRILGPGSCCSAVAWPRQRLLKLGLDKLLNEAPHALADTRLDRAEPVVKKIVGCISCRMQRLRLRAMDSHGGVGLHRRAN